VRHIRRLNEPAVITRLGNGWLQAFLASGNKRPNSNTYSHTEVRELLNSMSHTKCYYCETILKDKSSEVDHFIEIFIDKNLAFIWNNLYLACDNCNGKVPHDSIPVTDCLDPCVDTDDVIATHLAFNDNIIVAKNDSQKGNLTITKYMLGSKHLDYLRGMELIKFYKLLTTIQDEMINDGRAILPEELEHLKSFTNSSKPYSLMFREILRSNGFT